MQDSQEHEGGTNLFVFSMIFLIGEFMVSMCVLL